MVRVARAGAHHVLDGGVEENELDTRVGAVVGGKLRLQRRPQTCAVAHLTRRGTNDSCGRALFVIVSFRE